MTEISTKEKLLEAAVDLFASKGYDATSVDEIAESLGIKGPNLYRFFKGKAALLDAVIARFDTEYSEKMGLFTESPAVPDNGNELKKLTMRQVEYTINEPTLIKFRKIFSQEQYRSPEFSKLATKYEFSNIETMYSGIFAKMAANGIIKENDSETLALEYISPVSLMIKLSDREPDMNRYAMKRIEAHIDFFIEKYIDNK